jgi:hypothetical protein
MTYLHQWPLTLQQSLGLLSSSFLLYMVYLVVKRVVVLSYLSPLKLLPGPPGYDSLIWGHLGRIFAASGAVIHEEWVQMYGPTMRYRGFFLVRSPFTSAVTIQ